MRTLPLAILLTACGPGRPGPAPPSADAGAAVVADALVPCATEPVAPVCDVENSSPTRPIVVWQGSRAHRLGVDASWTSGADLGSFDDVAVFRDSADLIAITSADRARVLEWSTGTELATLGATQRYRGFTASEGARYMCALFAEADDDNASIGMDCARVMDDRSVERKSVPLHVGHFTPAPARFIDTDHFAVHVITRPSGNGGEAVHRIYRANAAAPWIQDILVTTLDSYFGGQLNPMAQSILLNVVPQGASSPVVRLHHIPSGQTREERPGRLISRPWRDDEGTIASTQMPAVILDDQGQLRLWSPWGTTSFSEPLGAAAATARAIAGNDVVVVQGLASDETVLHVLRVSDRAKMITVNSAQCDSAAVGVRVKPSAVGDAGGWVLLEEQEAVAPGELRPRRLRLVHSNGCQRHFLDAHASSRDPRVILARLEVDAAFQVFFIADDGTPHSLAELPFSGTAPRGIDILLP